MNGDKREYTLHFKADDMAWSGLTEQFVELEDMTDYILEEDKESVNKYIEKLQHLVRELKAEVSHLRGEVTTWEKMWRIYNS